jgi:V8-like Glu-specific endopeptidase
MVTRALQVIAVLLLFPLIASAQDFLSYRVPESAAAVEAYWTPERMANAKSKPLLQLQADLPAKGQAIEESSYNYPPPHTTYTWDSTKALSLYAQHPFKAMGKIFFTDDEGDDLVCSGTSIGGRAVLTAGHCISNGKGTYFTNVMFVPAYSKPNKTGTIYNAPFGKWHAEELWTFSEYHQSKDSCRDVAFLVTKKNAGMTLSQRVGSLGIAVNKPQVQHWNAFGWPADPPYDGRFMVQTQASFSALASDRALMTCTNVLVPQGMGTIQTGGCSGGPWILDLDPYERGTTGNLVNSVNSFSWKGSDYEIFGPYFDDEVLKAWTEFTKK